MGSVTTAQPGYCWLPFPGKQWRERCRVSPSSRSPGHHVAQRLAPLITCRDLAAGGAVTLWVCDVSGIEVGEMQISPPVGARRKPLAPLPRRAQL